MLNCYDNENSLVDIVNKIQSLEVFKNGNIKLVENNEESFLQIKDNLKDLFSSSRLMPAFGVSLHNDTLNEIKKGIWLKINFDSKIEKSGLPFNSLIFKLEEVQGFNLIRLYNNTYDGRCLYLDLDEVVNLMNLINLN